MKTYRFDALQKPLEAERQWRLIAASVCFHLPLALVNVGDGLERVTQNEVQP